MSTRHTKIRSTIPTMMIFLLVISFAAIKTIRIQMHPVVSGFSFHHRHQHLPLQRRRSYSNCRKQHMRHYSNRNQYDYKDDDDDDDDDDDYYYFDNDDNYFYPERPSTSTSASVGTSIIDTRAPIVGTSNTIREMARQSRPNRFIDDLDTNDYDYEYDSESNTLDDDIKEDQLQRRTMELPSGNFWMNPVPKTTAITPGTTKVRRSARINQSLQQQQGQVLDDSRRRNSRNISRIQRNRGIGTTQQQALSSPLLQLYERLFWFGLNEDATEMDEEEDEEDAVRTKRTMFGGTKGKFNGMNYIYDTLNKEDDDDDNDDGYNNPYKENKNPSAQRPRPQQQKVRRDIVNLANDNIIDSEDEYIPVTPPYDPPQWQQQELQPQQQQQQQQGKRRQDRQGQQRQASKSNSSNRSMRNPENTYSNNNNKDWVIETVGSWFTDGSYDNNSRTNYRQQQQQATTTETIIKPITVAIETFLGYERSDINDKRNTDNRQMTNQYNNNVRNNNNRRSRERFGSEYYTSDDAITYKNNNNDSYGTLDSTNRRSLQSKLRQEQQMQSRQKEIPNSDEERQISNPTSDTIIETLMTEHENHQEIFHTSTSNTMPLDSETTKINDVKLPANEKNIDEDVDNLTTSKSNGSKKTEMEEMNDDVKVKPLSWEERLMAMERVPPVGIKAWGPCGISTNDSKNEFHNNPIDARTIAFQDAIIDVQMIHKQIHTLKEQIASLQKDIGNIRNDIELNHRQLQQIKREQQQQKQKSDEFYYDHYDANERMQPKNKFTKQIKFYMNNIRRMEKEIDAISYNIRYKEQQTKRKVYEYNVLVHRKHWAIFYCMKYIVSDDSIISQPIQDAFQELEVQESAVRQQYTRSANSDQSSNTC